MMRCLLVLLGTALLHVPVSGADARDLSIQSPSNQSTSDAGPILGQLSGDGDEEAAACTYIKGQDYYDLTPLSTIQSEFRLDDNGRGDEDDSDDRGDRAKLAICRPLDGSEDDGITWKGRSLGRYSSRVKYHDRETLSLTYDGGASCGDRGSRLSTLILFKCYVEASKNPLLPTIRPQTDRPILISQDTSNDHCQVILQWTTTAACPRPRPDTSGLTVKGAIYVFVSIIILAFVVWFVGTIVYKRAVLKERGWSQLPSSSSTILSSMSNVIILGLSNLYLFGKNLTSRDRGLSLGGNERSRSGYSSLAFFDAEGDEE